jgi:hypothetical protein
MLQLSWPSGEVAVSYNPFKVQINRERFNHTAVLRNHGLKILCGVIRDRTWTTIYIDGDSNACL